MLLGNAGGGVGLPLLRLDPHHRHGRLLRSSLAPCSSGFQSSSFFSRALVPMKRRTWGGSCKGGAFSLDCSGETLRWVSTISAVALLFAKNTGIRKSLLVPLLALQMPQDVINHMRGEMGLWSAFLALCARLFYVIPGELELPLILLLLVITSPQQFLLQRSTQAGLLVWATLSSYLGFQHFTKAGGFSGAFQQNLIVPSVASILLVAVPVVLLYQGY